MVTWTPAAESCRLGGQGPPRRHPPHPYTGTHNAHTPVHQRRRRSASGTPATRRRPCAAPPRSAGSAAARCCTRPRCRCRALWSLACGEKAFNKEKGPKVWASTRGLLLCVTCPNMTRGTHPTPHRLLGGIKKDTCRPPEQSLAGRRSSEKEQLLRKKSVVSITVPRQPRPS